MTIILNERGNVTPITNVRPKTRQALLVFLKSADGETNWAPVLPADVPAWAKADDCLRRFMAGEMAQHANGGDWYRAEEQVQH